MKPYVIGVDAGGTKTSACAFSLDGTLLTRQISGPGNFSADASQALSNVLSAVNACRAALGEGCRYIAVGAAGLRGAGLGAQTEALLKERCGCPCRAVDDAMLALYAKLQGGDGVLVIAGTGSVAYAKAGAARVSSGGWGMLLDDRGSGTAIALEVLRRLVRNFDEGRALSDLEQALLRQMGCESPLLVPRFVSGAGKAQLAALAPLVESYAAQGDDAAGELLSWAGGELAAMAAVAARRLGLKAPCTAVSGSILEKCAPVTDAFWDEWNRLLPGARPVHSTDRAEKGALWFYREEDEA